MKNFKATLASLVSYRTGIELITILLLLDLVRSIAYSTHDTRAALLSLVLYFTGLILGAGLVLSVDRRAMSFKTRLLLFKKQFLSRYL